MDAVVFVHEIRELTQQIADSKLIEQRLEREIAQNEQQAAATGSFPPGYQESRWLLSRQKSWTQQVRNKLDRAHGRRKEAVAATILEQLRAKFPADVARIEQGIAAEFALPVDQIGGTLSRQGDA